MPAFWERRVRQGKTPSTGQYCSAFGDTEEEAIKEVKIAASLWLSAAKQAGRKAPEPIVEKKFAEQLTLHRIA